MRIEGNDERFKPIVIVLESEAEAKVLWHRLNLSTDLIKKYYNSESLGFKDAIELEAKADKHDMWNVLDNEVTKRDINPNDL